MVLKSAFNNHWRLHSASGSFTLMTTALNKMFYLLTQCTMNLRFSRDEYCGDIQTSPETLK